ncbi:MAG: SCP2 sterol-binding domain-containing protein [Thermoplasmata archaeon]
MADKDEVKEMIEKVVTSFRNKAKEEPKLKQKLKDFERDIVIDLEDDLDYHFTISNGDVSDLEEGKLEKADITIDTDSGTLKAILSKEMRPMEAYARKKIKIDASFLDLLKIKDLF